MTVHPDDRTVRAARQPVVRRARQHRPSRAACRVSEASPGLPAGQEMHPLRGAPDEPCTRARRDGANPRPSAASVASGLSWSKERPQGRRKCSSTAPGGSRADGPVRARGWFEWVGGTRRGFGPLASSAGLFSVRHGSAWGPAPRRVHPCRDHPARRRRLRVVRDDIGSAHCSRRAGLRKPLGPDETPLRETELRTDRQATQPVLHASAEVDRGGLGEVLRRAADFGNRVSVPEDLRKHLVVEDEIVRVGLEGQTLEQLARAKARYPV